ncbi:hypothetical protein CC85DRAFT_288584 [Cutaneotrichosporon oleaginosum]|uniref:Uncharacterized protein n=1 Tax=Cutaneotrichosporon oleaginosum TaxID=879819 RepID=A0A0J0XEB6_9TREE|nr:uncharacterized protein CC85DRAFT_288584 [Cutaneotrichosporon oleaginosum]KLT39392.1 hypothetical protein CC85DRAFT_288584 [Cutaneotrichosporon oleaginosum]TXT07543.1 hypothetical protein COLE_04467 [Cutaneotrichosporon oleaginosum]
MIIPPDPEKDPRLFRGSTTSLVTVPEDQLVDVETLEHAPAHPGNAYSINPAAPVAYPYGGPFGDAFTVPFDPVPPYSARRELDPVEHAAYGAPPLGRTFSRASRGSTSTSASGSSTESNATPTRRRFTPLRSGSRTVSTPASSDTLLAARGTKLWEGSATRGPARRWLGIPIPPRSIIPISPEAKGLWHKYRRLWIAMFVCLAIGIVLAVGLAAGLVLSNQKGPSHGGKGDAWRNNRKGQNTTYPTTPDLSISYHEDRDGPFPEDGEATQCNQFTPLNQSSALTQLAVNSPHFAHYISTYSFPLSAHVDGMAALSHNLYVLARGLAATGTVEIVGSNAPSGVIHGGEEGVVKIDVLARYQADQELAHVARVCHLQREDGSSGVGIFTPVETDGGAEGPFLLNPMYTPAFHVVIRMPPSLLATKNDTVGYLPGLSLELAQMGTRIGNLQQVALIGDLRIHAGSRGGGVVVDYASCKTCTIVGAENTVQGTFNVTENLAINSTSGTILANVILSDPERPGDDSATITSMIPMPHSARRRSLNPLAERAFVDKIVEPTSAKYPGMKNLDASEDGPDHVINTTFCTNEGFIFVAYLHHPPSTALRAWVSSESGMVDVSMHPNYVGPFALENMWGAIRLPPVQVPKVPDPIHQGRSRIVIQGPVDLNSTTFFGGLNVTDEITAPNSVTGAAAWAWVEKGHPSVSEVQNGFEGRGSALVAVATLGDLQVTFDGT